MSFIACILYRRINKSKSVINPSTLFTKNSDKNYIPKDSLNLESAQKLGSFTSLETEKKADTQFGLISNKKLKKSSLIEKKNKD